MVAGVLGLGLEMGEILGYHEFCLQNGVGLMSDLFIMGQVYMGFD